MSTNSAVSCWRQYWLSFPLAGGLMGAALATPVSAQTTDWKGVGDDWFIATNWSSGVVPGLADDVAIDTRIFTPPLISGSGASARRLYVGGQFDINTGAAGTGSGALVIANGGQLVNGGGNFFDTFIGVGTGSVGDVAINGTGSRWTSTDAVAVGSSGATGSLTVDDHGTAEFGALLVGVSLADISGLAITNGSGPSIGTVTVTGGGRLITPFFADAGVGIGAIGKITVSGAGSTLSSDGGVLIGVLGGTGTLDIVNGGTLTTGVNGPYPASVIGGGGPSNQGMGPSINGGIGTAAITGPGSTWTNSGGLYVGGFVDGSIGALYPGIGTLTIADGGRITSTGGMNSGLPDAIGTGAGSFGTVVVTDANSQWTAAQNLAVGFAGGTGTLTLEHGAAANVAGIFAVGIGIGPYLNSVGALNVHSGGTLVSNSGGLAADGVSVVGGGESTGTAVVSGAGSSWIINGGLFVGGQSSLELAPGVGTVTIADGGMIRAAEGVALAPDVGSTGTLNIGAAPGSPAVTPGTLDTPTVTFGNGTGAISFNHTASDYVFAPVVSGPGAVNQVAGTTILTGQSTYTGATTISAGTLRVDGSLGNTTVTVNGDGTLGGSGSIAGPVMVADGGKVAPGNSIGTLTLGGNYVQASGSTYQVELDAAGQSDHLVVGGAATIESGALVQVIRQDAASPLVLGTRYTILSAAGGVNGAYSTLTGDMATSPFLSLGLVYAPNNIYLDVSRSALRFADVGLTPNQRAVGSAIENLSLDHPLYQAIVDSSALQDARAAFDLSSGEIHASMASVAFEASRLPRAAILDRLWGPFETSPDVGTRSSNTSSLWLQGFGDSGHVDGDGNAATVTRSLGGFILGVDGHVDDRYRFGVAGGYTKSWLSIDARNSSGSAESVFGGIYGGAGFGALQLRGGVLYSHNDYDTTRRIDFPGFQDTERASYGGNTLQAFGEGGWLFSLPGVTIEPFAGVMAMSIDTNRFAETDGTAGLRGRSRSDSYQATTLGVRLASEPLDGFSVTGSLGWQRVFGDLKPTSVLGFNGTSTPFAITGAPIALDSLVIEAGLDWRITQSVSAGVAYSGALANKSYSNAIQGRIRIGL